MTAYHLAQLNCAVPRYDKTDPRFAGFVDHLDEINGLGDASPSPLISSKWSTKPANRGSVLSYRGTAQLSWAR